MLWILLESSGSSLAINSGIKGVNLEYPRSWEVWEMKY